MRSRGESLSAGKSFIPSGIQKFVMTVSDKALPIFSAILRQAIAWAIQNLRTGLSALESVKPSAASGCEKNVGLKSIPILRSLHQSVQPLKLSKEISSRSTFFPKNSPYMACRFMRVLPGIYFSASSISALSSSTLRALPGKFPVACMPPQPNVASGVSNPPTSSPCQQCIESGILSSTSIAFSVSTPKSAYICFAVL